MSHDVSICIANYNMEDTICESLKSILENIPDDYELVIVDESDDDSREVIKSLKVKNPIKTIYVSNYGYSASINRAVEEASGNIVLTHVDMDDWYDSRFFEPFVELYIEIREERGGENFWFSCPNFNITGRAAYLERYKLKDLPIGAGEREYRWRLLMSDEFVGVDIDKKISSRINLSERKTLLSRMERTFNLIVGLFQIGYTLERVVKEEILYSSRPLHSKLFTLIVIPFAYIVAQSRSSVESNVPEDGEPLKTHLSRNTYTLNELQERYSTESHSKIISLEGLE